MSERSREKIALAVFALLVVFAGCCLGGYLVAGHSWNVAASSIDDTFGSMEGYTAIVYEGTVDPRPAGAPAAGGTGAAQGADEDGDADAGSALAGDALGGRDARGLSGELADAGSEAQDAGAGAAGVPSGGNPDAADAAGDADATPASADAASTGGTAAGGSASASAAKDPVTAEEARASYEEKNATVVTLDTAHIGTYRDGRILKKGDQRFGVFSVDENTTLLQIKRHVKYFEEHEVDFVVALTPDKELLVGAASGIDIVISTQDENLFVMGETQDGTFFVDAPETGSVGVILISPSNVVSAKVIEEL